MRYKNYHNLKDLWNIEIPSHWSVGPLYSIAKEKSISNCTELPLLSVYLDAGVIPFESRSEKRTNATSQDLSKYQRVDCGDFVLNNQQAWRGSVGVSKQTGIISPAYIVLSLDKSLNSKYANYLFRSPLMVAQYVLDSKGVGTIQRNIYWTRLKRNTVLIPPRDEQYQIVKYLDWQVSKINKLISNYRLQVAFLNEMKEQRINEKVFNGVRKSTLIHNNDIRWDIDYPKHWEIKRIRESFSFRKGLSITKANLEDAGIAVISYGQVHSKKNSGVGLNKELIKYVNESYLTTNQSCLVEKGDFIFADTSEDVKSCGNCAYIDWDDIIFAGYHSIIAHCNNSTNNKYLAYLFKSPTWRYQIYKKVDGVKVYSITQKMLKDVFILLPPQDEQEEIVNYLDSICARIDVAIAKAEEKISNLHDLKTCLVADAVTGQIDVRGIKIPEYEFVDVDPESDNEEDDDKEGPEEPEE